eukprot:gene2218-2735_t
MSKASKKSSPIPKVIKYGVILLFSVLIFNTITFTSKQPKVEVLDKDHVDTPTSLTEEELAHRLGKAVSIETISFSPDSPFTDDSGFLKFHGFLEKTFPRAHSRLEVTKINTYSLLFHWKGQNPDLKPVMLCGHMDVVPITHPERWEFPPFGGNISDGFIWGRGTMDDKLSVMGILETVEELLTTGFVPQRSIYLAFGHDEELGGFDGAAHIGKYLKSRGVQMEYILDEGLPIIMPPVFPGVNRPIASVGTAEKGFLLLELSVEWTGGHSSVPARETAIGILSNAIAKVEANPMKPAISEASKLFDFVGRESTLPLRFVFSNLWLFQPLVTRILSNNPSLDAIQRTTTAITMFHAGNKPNVLPFTAKAIINFRVAPSDSLDSVVEHIRSTINDPRVLINVTHRLDPAPVSSADTPTFKLLQKTILQEFPEVIVAPTIMVANTDTRWYWDLSKNIYRFCPQRLITDDLSRIHGINERISTSNYKQIVDFYYHLIRNGDQQLNKK